MAIHGDIVASLDIGSSKIKVLIAEENDGLLTIHGHGSSACIGVNNGVINDVVSVTNSIKKAVKQASSSCNIAINSVSVNISDHALMTSNIEGQIAISGDKIIVKDVKNVIKTTNDTFLIPSDKQILTNIPTHFSVDERARMVVVNNPIGLQAKVLRVKMHIIAVSNSSINAIEQSISDSNLGMSKIVLSSMASSSVCASYEDKNRGVCLFDIGAEVTDLAVFVDGNIVHNNTFQFGGKRVTQNIASAFNTSLKQAEILKLAHGRAINQPVVEERLIKFEQIQDESAHYLSNYSLFEVIKESYLSLFSLIKDDLRHKNLQSVIKSGFIITGGATDMFGCDKLLADFFKKVVQIGAVHTSKIKKYTIFADSSYTCALGLLLKYNEVLNKESMQGGKADFIKNLIPGF